MPLCCLGGSPSSNVCVRCSPETPWPLDSGCIEQQVHGHVPERLLGSRAIRPISGYWHRLGKRPCRRCSAARAAFVGVASRSTLGLVRCGSGGCVPRCLLLGPSAVTEHRRGPLGPAYSSALSLHGISSVAKHTRK